MSYFQFFIEQEPIVFSGRRIFSLLFAHLFDSPVVQIYDLRRTQGGNDDPARKVGKRLIEGQNHGICLG